MGAGANCTSSGLGRLRTLWGHYVFNPKQLRGPVPRPSKGTPNRALQQTAGADRFSPTCSSMPAAELDRSAVNAETRIPGESYPLAPGCSIVGWPDEATAVIVFTGYPATAT